MSSITLKNIPEHLHLTYKRRARQHARSLQAEILHTLGQFAGSEPDDTTATVEEVAGCIKLTTKRYVSLEAMNEAVDAKFRREWRG